MTRISSRVSLKLITVTLLSLATSKTATAASLYSITDIGTLPGYQVSTANAINNKDQIVGYSSGPGDHAFLYSDGMMKDLGTPPGFSASSANSINDLGQVVGQSGNVSFGVGGGDGHALLYDSTGLHDIGTLPGGTTSGAYGINNSGQVVGYSFISSNSYHPFLYSDGMMKDLGTLPGGTTSGALDINNKGQVVGFSDVSGFTNHAFLYSDGIMKDLGTLPGGIASYANSINDSGQVVGYSYGYGTFDGGTADVRPFLFNGSGPLQNIGSLGGSRSFASSINNYGQVVGYSRTANDATVHPFLYEHGKINDLNNLIDPNSGWELNNASAINNKGDIVGNGTFNGQGHAFLAISLTPPTPSPIPDPLPSLLTLANLDKDVYSANSVGFGDYTSIGNNCSLVQSTCDYLGLKGVEYASPDKSQIVVAFRGTTFGLDKPVTELKNLATDISFIGTTPSPDLSRSVTNAVAFLQSVKEKNPNANITLTGHSLGGSIAQLLGEASGLTTDAFNAPGAAQLYPSLSSTLAPIHNLSDSGNENKNYRIFSDPFSLFGDPIGSQVTLPPPPDIPSTGDLTVTDPAKRLLKFVGSILEYHDIGTIINQIQNNAQPISNIDEQNLTSVIHDIVQPVGLALGTTDTFKFAFVVSSLGSYILDPSSGTDFLFTEDPGSPYLASIDLPAFSNVNSYDIRYKTGDTWSPFQQIQPGVENILASGVDGLEFAPLDSNGQPIALPDSFFFGTSFSSLGNFSGTLTITQPVPVPEPPSTAGILIFGGFLARYLWKRKKGNL